MKENSNIVKLGLMVALVAMFALGFIFLFGDNQAKPMSVMEFFVTKGIGIACFLGVFKTAKLAKNL